MVNCLCSDLDKSLSSVVRHYRQPETDEQAVQGQIAFYLQSHFTRFITELSKSFCRFLGYWLTQHIIRSSLAFVRPFEVHTGQSVL